jgi:cobalamin biosynthesis Mg chelatase CobN
VGRWSTKLRRGIVALACVVIAAAAAGRAAAEGPKPEPSPSPARATIHAEAAPGSHAAQKTYSSSQGSYASTPNSSSISPPAETSRPAITFPPATRPHVRAPQTPVHPTVKTKKDPPVRLPTKRVESIAAAGGEILTTTARGLTKTPSSSESLLLLLVGLALVVLVVGEMTFLRLAARGPAPRKAAEETLPIRRVQLKR